MARRSPQTFLKRQREQKRAEKARLKLIKREERKAGLVSMDITPDDAVDSDSGDPTETVDADDGGDSASVEADRTD